MKYLVEVTAPLPSDIDAAAERVAETFGIGRDRVMALFDRAPGVVTRPLDEHEANRVIDTFSEVGIWAQALPFDPDAPTVLDLVLGTAGSEPMKGVSGRRDATVTDMSLFVPVATGYGGEIQAAIHREATDDAPPPDAITEDFGDAAGDVVGHASLQPDYDASGFGVSQTEMSPMEVSRVDVSDPGGNGFDHDDAAHGSYAAPHQPELSTSDAAVYDRVEPHDASEVVSQFAEPEQTEAKVDDEGPFDVQAFTRALLNEHGLDESLLDGLESEAEAFDLRDRGARLSEDPPEVLARRSPFLSRVEEPVENERGVRAVPIGAESDEPPAFVRERTTAGRSVRAPGMSLRNGLRFKLLLAGLMPALLTAVFALAAVAVTLLPMLRAQQGDGAASAAGTFAAALSTRLVDRTFDSPAASAELQRAALEARSSLLADGIDFLLITDPQGTPLAGWSPSSDDPARVALEVVPAAASTLEALFGTPITVADPVDTGPLLVPDRIAVAPLLVEGSAIGAVLAGSTFANANRFTLTVLLITLGAALIPLLIAIVASVALTGSLLHNLQYLTRAADRISRGKLARPVELDTGDELDDLARAIERMRISLQEGMERLRRRRQ